MSETPVKNAIVHHDYISNDPEATQAFYGKLFGWKFENWDPTYSMFQGPAGTAGGLRKPTEGENTGVLNYILVKDLAAAVKDAEAVGAKILVPRQEVADMGALAVFIAPGGIVQGIWEPAPQ